MSDNERRTRFSLLFFFFQFFWMKAIIPNDVPSVTRKTMERTRSEGKISQSIRLTSLWNWCWRSTEWNRSCTVSARAPPSPIWHWPSTIILTYWCVFEQIFHLTLDGDSIGSRSHDATWIMDLNTSRILFNVNPFNRCMATTRRSRGLIATPTLESKTAKQFLGTNTTGDKSKVAKNGRIFNFHFLWMFSRMFSIFFVGAKYIFEYLAQKKQQQQQWQNWIKKTNARMLFIPLGSEIYSLFNFSIFWNLLSHTSVPIHASIPMYASGETLAGRLHGRRQKGIRSRE